MTTLVIRCDRRGQLIESGRAMVALEAGPRPPSYALRLQADKNQRP